MKREYYTHTRTTFYSRTLNAGNKGLGTTTEAYTKGSTTNGNNLTSEFYKKKWRDFGQESHMSLSQKMPSGYTGPKLLEYWAFGRRASKRSMRSPLRVIHGLPDIGSPSLTYARAALKQRLRGIDYLGHWLVLLLPFTGLRLRDISTCGIETEVAWHLLSGSLIGPSIAVHRPQTSGHKQVNHSYIGCFIGAVPPLSATVT